MNIGLLTPDYPTKSRLTGGIGTHFAQLAQALSQLGHEVHVMTIGDGQPRDYVEDSIFIHELGIRLPAWCLKGKWRDRLPIRDFYVMWKMGKELSRLAREHQLEVIEATSFQALTLNFLWRRQRPHVVTRVSTTFHGSVKERVSKLSAKQNFLCWLEKLAVRYSDSLLTHTRGHLREVSTELGVEASRFHIIPHGLSLPIRSSLGKSKSKEARVNVLYVGRFEGRKGFDILLKAIPMVLRQDANIEFTLIGRDRDHKHENAFFKGEGAPFKNQVRFAGRVDQETLIQSYQNCDIFVAPSRYESFGYIYVEAMSYGKPVIGCRVGGVPEVISDHETGLIAEPEDAVDLSKKILQLAQNQGLREVMGQKARQRVSDLFTSERMAKRSVHLYRSKIKKLVNIYRTDPNNLGDCYSTPAKYFDFLKDSATRDIHHLKPSTDLRDTVVILGGGGLVANSYFEEPMRNLLKSKPQKIVLWGAGHNLHDGRNLELPDYLNQMALVGMRDYGTPFDWVPCSSCMSPAFDQSYEIKHPYVIYENSKHAPIHFNGYPKASNRTREFEKIIEFLASGETILTSTYHGAYWGILLNRKVIVINPFSSKFYGMKYPVPIANEQNWKEKIGETVNYPQALKECRQANLDFSNKVQAMIGMK